MQKKHPDHPLPGIAPAVCASRAGGSWLRREDAVLAAMACVEIWADEPRGGEQAADDALAEMRRIERIANPDNASSELCWLNRQAAAVAVQLSDEMAYLVERALVFARLSEGAFDISCAVATRLYDHQKGTAADAPSLLRARQLTGMDKLLLDPVRRSLRFARQGMRIDFGGLFKGHAVDRAVAVLLRRGVRHASVSIGRHSRVIGDRRGRPWRIDLHAPVPSGAPPVSVPLHDCAASIVDDGRYFELGGVRQRTLIDARTGRSTSSGLRSVVVLASDCLSSEALAKCVFLLGIDKGRQLLAGLPGVQAFCVDLDHRLHRMVREHGVAQRAALPQ